MFESILKTTETTISAGTSIISLVGALGLGILIALVYILSQKKGTYTKDYVVAVSILPAIVCLVIMLVGNSVARAFSLAGAFALIRFRSAPGSAKDIAVVFLTMATGLACGLGFIIFGAIAAVIICLVLIILSVTKFAEPKVMNKVIKITIPEDLNYQGVFDEIFSKYASAYELDRVKTTNMGTLYELTYKLNMNDGVNEKEMIDEIRTRNGNLGITLGVITPEVNTTL